MSINKVWAIDEGSRVRQDDLTHPYKNGTGNAAAVWDGTTIKIFGARNEIIGFQVILESATSSSSAVQVTLDKLQYGDYIIQNTGGIGDPLDFDGKYIEVFVEHYHYVTGRSGYGGSWGWVLPCHPDRLDLVQGWLPDALVPAEATNKTPTTGQGGMPFSIVSGKNQGVWIDVYIPETQPAGVYTGTVKVIEGSTTTYNIPIQLTVYDFTLPHDTHFHTMFINGAAIPRHGVTYKSVEWWALYRNYMNVFHRHRLDLNENATPSEFTTNMLDFYTGSAYTSANNYDGPGKSVGNRTYGIGVYDQPHNSWRSGFAPDVDQDTEATWQAGADAWETLFQANADDVVRFKYMWDEPGTDPAALANVIQRANWVKTSAGVGQDLLIYCTSKIHPSLYGYVDFWSLTGQSNYDPGDGILTGYNEPTVVARQALGEKIAFYNGTIPAYGNTELLDNNITDNRVNPWIGFKHNVDQYFLWNTAEIIGWTPKQNLWNQYYGIVGAYKNWGYGTYIYTGEDVEFPGDSRGVAGPIASIRMKNFRRGQQDYEYLRLAQLAGKDTTTIVNAIIPQVLDKVAQDIQPTWPRFGYVFEDARLELANMLKGGTVVDLPPTITTQPQNKSVVVGQPATFTVTASSTLPVTYQWKRDAVDILDAVYASYTIPSTRIIDNGAIFRCVVTNANGSTASGEAALTVTQLPTSGNILLNPDFADGMNSWFFYANTTPESSVVTDDTGAHVTTGSTGTNIQLSQAALTVVADQVYRLTFTAKSVPARSIEVSLHKHTDPYTNYGLNSTFALTADDVEYTTTFTCSHSSSEARLMFWMAPYAQADDVFTFNTVSLKIEIPSPPDPPDPPEPPDPPSAVYMPTITYQPQSLVVTAGNFAAFAIVASGTLPMTYQWILEGEYVVGATDNTYIIDAVTTSMTGSQIYCVVTNSLGAATSDTVTLTVLEPLPQYQYVSEYVSEVWSPPLGILLGYIGEKSPVTGKILVRYFKPVG